MRAGPWPATAAVRATAVAVLTAALLGGCADDDPSPASASGTAVTATSPTAATTPATAAPTTSSGTAPGEAAAVAAVDAWLAALADGDVEAVLAGLGPTSTAALEAMGGLDAVGSGLSEGLATFADPSLSRTAVAVPGHDGAWLVTITGQRTAEGTTAYDARSFLVVPGEQGPLVETFATPLPEVVSPQDPASARPDEAVVVTLPAGGDVLAYLDGTTPLPDPQVEGIDGDRVRITAAPVGGLPAGDHAVTVVVVPAAGAPAPWAVIAVALRVG